MSTVKDKENREVMRGSYKKVLKDSKSEFVF